MIAGKGLECDQEPMANGCGRGLASPDATRGRLAALEYTRPVEETVGVPHSHGAKRIRNPCRMLWQNQRNTNVSSKIQTKGVPTRLNAVNGRAV